MHWIWIVTIWVVIFEGLKFCVLWICYKLEIFMDINFHGCFILCVFLYLPKYIPMETTWFSSVIRGHHIYKEVWELMHGQILQCERKSSNMFDPFVVSIMNDCKIVGHVPQWISKWWWEWWVNVLLHSYLANGMKYRIFPFCEEVLLKLIFMVCDVLTKFM